MKKFLMILTALALAATGFGQVQQGALPTELKGCKSVDTISFNRLVVLCDERAMLVEVAFVKSLPANEKREHEDIAIYSALNLRSFSVSGKEPTTSTVTVRPKSVTPSGAVVAEVIVEKGEHAGNNLGVYILADGSGTIDEADANVPAEYKYAATKGMEDRKRRLEYAKLASPDVEKK